MLETKDIGQGAVTTIADNALIMVADGGYKPISFADLMKAVRSGIQVGGMNLLTGTRDWSLGWENQSNYTVGPDKYKGLTVLHYGANAWQGLNQAINSLAGKKCMLSMYCKVSTTGTIVFRIMRGSTGTGLTWTMNKANEWIRLAYPVNLPEDATQLRVELGSGTATGICLCGLKLEEGNIATDWSPAPEDIASGSWGGVIGSQSITYGSAEKGGAHEHADYGPLGCAEDGVLCRLFGQPLSDCSGYGRKPEEGAALYVLSVSGHIPCGCEQSADSDGWNHNFQDERNHTEPSGRRHEVGVGDGEGDIRNPIHRRIPGISFRIPAFLPKKEYRRNVHQLGERLLTVIPKAGKEVAV